jgi:hypothetical protein
MEDNKDKIIRDFIKMDHANIKVPANFSLQVMDKIDVKKKINYEPLISTKGWVLILIILLIIILIPVFALINFEFLTTIEINKKVLDFFKSIEVALIGLGIGIFLLVADIIWRLRYRLLK